MLRENWHLLSAEATVLDYACGLGGNAIFLAKKNLPVHAWDISTVAIDKITQYAKDNELSIKLTVRDVELNPVEPETFDAIVVSNFLHRPTFNSLLAGITPGGLLFYQTFTVNKLDNVGPTNPDYLLQTNELLEQCINFEILVYREEGKSGNINLGWRNQAMIVAKKSC